MLKPSAPERATGRIDGVHALEKVFFTTQAVRPLCLLPHRSHSAVVCHAKTLPSQQYDVKMQPDTHAHASDKNATH